MSSRPGNRGRVLVTGSDGYIGGVLMPWLRGSGHDAVGLDTGWFADGAFVPPEAAWTTVRRDVRDVVPDDLRGFDAVVHLAALCNDPLGELDPELTSEINYRGTVRVAEAARQAGVRRFIFASSCSLYGVADVSRPVGEGAPFNPQTAYALSKTNAERDLLAMAAADPAFCPVLLRFATAYGISPRQRFDLVVPNLAGHAHTRGEVRLTSDGTPWRPLAHIRDISSAVAAALSAPEAAVRGEAFNIGRDEDNYTVRAIAEQVRATFPGSHLTVGPPGGDNRSYRVDFSKAATRLPGFAPRWDLARGAGECREVFERVRLDVGVFEDRRYTRLKQIRHLLDTGRLDGRLRWREGRS